MACDIHLVVERQVEGKWITVRLFDGFHCNYGEVGWNRPIAGVRNYKRFAALAGVRGAGPDARGLPDGLSDTARHLVEVWGVDGHSHSWLPLDEAAAIFQRTEVEPENLTEFEREHPSYFYFGHEDEINGKWPHRLVFWFDN